MHANTRQWWLLGASICFGALLFWCYAALPFMDLPAHAGLIALRHRFASSPFEQRFFIYDPHVGPYTVFRELGDLFTGVVGPVGAVRLLATLPVFATPLAVAFSRRRLHGDTSPSMPFMSLCLCFNLMTLFGLASYLLGVAVLVVTLTVWLELLADVDAGTADWRRELLVGALALALFVTHGDAFVTFLALAGIATLATGRRVARMLRGRALVPAVAFAAYVAWIERASNVPLGSIKSAHDDVGIVFQGPLDKLSLLVTPTLMTRTGIDIAVGVIIWIMTTAGIVATTRAVYRKNELISDRTSVHVRGLTAALAFTMTCFFLLPHAIRWFGFVDGRLVLVAALLGLLVVRKDALSPRLGKAFESAPPVLALAIIVLAHVASWRFQDEATGYREVLAQVPAEARLLNLPLEPNSEIFAGHPFVHYDKLALAERPLLVSDVWLHQGTALFARPENPALRLPASYLEADLKRIDWPLYDLRDWDYVLVRTRPTSAEADVPSTLERIAHEGGWWLYRVKPQSIEAK